MGNEERIKKRFEVRGYRKGKNWGKREKEGKKRRRSKIRKERSKEETDQGALILT